MTVHTRNTHPAGVPVYCEFDVPATFLVVGQEAERFPGIVRQIAEADDVVGNRTFVVTDHISLIDQIFIYRSRSRKDIALGNSGQKSDGFRPPSGKLSGYA